MYSLVVKAQSGSCVIQLPVTDAATPAKPTYTKCSKALQELIEDGYGPFGHNLGSSYSVEELEFVLVQQRIKFVVLKDVSRAKFYNSQIKADSYT